MGKVRLGSLLLFLLISVRGDAPPLMVITNAIDPSGSEYGYKSERTQEVKSPPPASATELYNEFLGDFENYVFHLPISSFEGDAILIQFPDRLNSRTSYRHLDPSIINEVVYETSSVDVGAEVIILKSEEDHLPQRDKTLKRIYVVLRRALLLDPRVYYVAYAYLTEAGENQTGVHNFGDKKVFVEWDFWDHREVEDARAKKLENAFRCSNSIFIPCASNETFDFPSPASKPKNNFPATEVGSEGSERPLKKSHFGRFMPNEISKGIQIAEGFDANEFMDIYTDLDVEIKGGRESYEMDEDLSGLHTPFVGRSMSAVTETMSKMIASASGKIKDAIKYATEVGMGLIKHFKGLYGGIGTPEADPASVELNLGIEGGDRIAAQNSPAEEAELEAELKLESAGGLGGMVSGSDTKEDEGGEPEATTLAPKGRSIGPAWGPTILTDSNLPIIEEKPYVQYGWINANTNADLTSANDPFVGFGGCRYHRVKTSDLERVTTEEDLIRIYQTALKTQCVKYDAEFLMEIINDGLLRSANDKSLELVNNSPHFTMEKLNVKQLKELLRGMELFIFSKIYNQELRSPTPSATAPDGSSISRSVFTLGQSIIFGTAMAQENLFPIKHGFKLSRNLIKTLRTAYLKRVEDIELVTPEGDTQLEKEINFSDRVYLMSLIQYLMHGATPVFQSAIDPYKNFQEFYHKNKAILEEKVNNNTPR